MSPTLDAGMEYQYGKMSLSRELFSNDLCIRTGILVKACVMFFFLLLVFLMVKPPCLTAGAYDCSGSL